VSVYLAFDLTRAATRPRPSARVRSPKHRVRCVGGAPDKYQLGLRKPQPAEAITHLLLTNRWLGHEVCHGMQLAARSFARLQGGALTVNGSCPESFANVNFTAGDGCYPCCRSYYDTFVYGSNLTEYSHCPPPSAGIGRVTAYDCV
jgi:hypothetical protein